MEDKNLNDTIKKAVTAESKKTNWLETLGISAEDIVKMREGAEKDEKYLTDIANKTTSNKSKHFIVVRSIVLDAHLRLDSCISAIIGFMLVFRAEYHGKEDAKYNYFKESIFRKAAIDKLQADKNKVMSEYEKFLGQSVNKK